MSLSDRWVAVLTLLWFVLCYAVYRGFRASLEGDRWPETDGGAEEKEWNI